MLNLRPVSGEVEVRAVCLCMALHTACRCGHIPVPFGRRRRMRFARPVARFALYVGQLRRADERLEAAVIEADDVAAHTLVIELLALALKRGHGVGVACLLPYRILLGVAGLAG